MQNFTLTAVPAWDPGHSREALCPCCNRIISHNTFHSITGHLRIHVKDRKIMRGDIPTLAALISNRRGCNAHFREQPEERRQRVRKLLEPMGYQLEE